MPADSSIYGLIRPQAQAPGPLDQYAQAMTLRNLMGQQDLQGMQLAQGRRNMETQDQLRSLFARNPNPSATEIGAIDPAYAQKYRTGQLTNQKTEAEIKDKQLDAIKKTIETGREKIANINNDAALAAFREEIMRQSGPDAVRDMPASVADPRFKEWQLTHVQKASDIVERLKPLYSVQDFGGTKGIVQANPQAPGGVTGLQTKTQTPDSVASVGATIRGQNLTDARAKETLAAGRWTNDLERGIQVNTATGETRPITTAGAPIGKKEKELTDAQAKALLYSNRMEEAEKVLTELEKQGRTKSTPGSRTGFGVGATINVLNTEAGQKLDQAKRNFINAVLRRESGAVIAESEFKNAEQQYFPQVGDTDSVIAQKAANRKTAIEGIKAEVPETRRAAPAPAAPTRAEIDAELRRRKVIP